MLYEDNRRTRNVKTFYIDTREKELLTGPWSQSNVDFSASYLIPVPAPLGGVLVIGMTTITYLHGVSGNVQTVEISPTQICAYGRIDALGTRYLLGDHRGQLMLVGLSVENNRVIGILTDIIGTTSIPETINYLNHGLVYIGSTLGDSQLIQLPNTVGSVDPDDGDAQNSIEVLDQYNNIGPILDMIIVNNEKNGGQQQLVTCSGAYKDGSIRIIRSGIGIHEQVMLLANCLFYRIKFSF
jgi:DNA damage-binding protein 1